MKHQRLWASVALLLVATFWGASWVGYRELYRFGMSGMSVGFFMTAIAALCSAFVARRSILAGGWRGIAPWLVFAIMISAALSNVGFTWGMVHGEVMRVMLLFYLMPVWSAIFAPLILGERSNWVGNVCIALGFVGAAIMLYPTGGGLPLPQTTAEWAGLIAGIGSGILNIWVRKTPELADELRSFFMLAGGALFALLCLPFEKEAILPVPEHMGSAVLIALVLGGSLFVVNRLYQYGLRHLTTHQAVVIFPFELVVGAVSSWLIAGEVMSMRAWIGGGFIVSAALIAAWWGSEK